MIKVLCLSVMALALWGCEEDARNIKIAYDQVYGLREGNLVRFDGRPIGKVTGIFYATQQKYLVDVAIDMAFANAVTEKTRFPIVEDPDMDGEKAIKVVNAEGGAPPLDEGATVQGNPPTPSPELGRIGEEIQRGIETFQEGIEEFVGSLDGISKSEEFRRIEEELSKMAEAMKRSGKAVQDKVQKEILPGIQKELERLRKKLEELGREEEVRPLENQLDEMMERKI